MSPSNPQHEPTMEEILASIRKIISEDTPESQPVPQPVQATPAQDADVLELTEEVREEPISAPPTPVAAAVATPPPVQPEPAADGVAFQPIEEPPVSSPAPVSASSGDGIFSDKARKALSEAFTHLEPEPEVTFAPGPAAPVAPVDGKTIELVFDRAVRETFDPVLQNWLNQNRDTVIERMKPVITQWLDEHFPALLEEAVRDELARVSKARVRR